MENRAGQSVDGNDILLRKELEDAGIEVVVHDEVGGGEVQTHITGKLPGKNGDWVFSRLWYYWSARKEPDSTPGLPLPIASKLHEQWGKDVRVAGHCGCPPPDYRNSDENIANGCSEYPWMSFFDEEGRMLISQAEFDYYNAKDNFVIQQVIKDIQEKYRIVPDISKDGVGHVQSYHIDTQEGLNALARTIKEANA